MNFLHVTVLASIVSALAAPDALAGQLCNDLRKILALTEQGYKPLQGGMDFFLDQHKGTVMPPPFTECYTKTSAGSSQYSCMSRLPDDESQAKLALGKLAQEVESCLGSDLVKRTGTQPDRPSYRNVNTGESISISLSRHVPQDSDKSARYTLRLRISSVE